MHVFPRSTAGPIEPLRLQSPGILGALVKTAAVGEWSGGRAAAVSLSGKAVA